MTKSIPFTASCGVSTQTGMIREFFKPTWMRIILFPLLLLVMPAFFNVCTDSCSRKLQWLAGLKLLALKEIGELTFWTMGAWFFAAYFFACLITINYEYFTEQ